MEKEEMDQSQNDKSDEESPKQKRYPERERKKPDYFGDSVCSFEDDLTNIDYCYRLLCNLSQTYKDAVTSPDAKEWINAMDEELMSLKDNATFTLTTLPLYLVGRGKGGGVYALTQQLTVSKCHRTRCAN